MSAIAGRLICAWVIWDGCKRAKRLREWERMLGFLEHFRRQVEVYKGEVSYEWRPTNG